MSTRRAFLRLPLGVPAALAAQSILDLPPSRKGLRIAYGAGEFQFADLRVPAGPGPHPAAIIIHGGYWRARYDLMHIGHLCDALTEEGVATWSLEYRRIGNPGGGWPGTFDDVRNGAAHLKKIAAAHHLDLERVVAAGHSAGGRLALWLAKQDAIALRGVAPLAPVADLRQAWDLKLSNGAVAELLGGSPREVPQRYRAASPVEMLPLGIRQRLVHGTIDDTVPIAMSRGYVKAARAKGDDATLSEIAGAGHFELIDPRSRAWPVVKRAMLEMIEVG